METRGTLKWRFKTNDHIDGSPIVDANRIIYFGSRDVYIYALNSDGSIKWTYKANDGFESSSALGSNGCLYIGSFDKNFSYIVTGNSDVGRESIGIPIYIEPGSIINLTASIRNYID